MIKDAILFQKFAPDAVYSQEAICQQLGVSRTPVREALLELQKEGFVRLYRGKGIQIVSLSDTAIHDILEMRLCLEMSSARLAARRATQDDLKYIGECLEASYNHLNEDREFENIAESYRLDHQFHRAVCLSAHNELLCKGLDEIMDLYLRFEVTTVYNNAYYANTIIEEHNRIYKAICDHDEQRAEYSAFRHLNDSYLRTLNKYWKTADTFLTIGENAVK